MRVKRPLEMHEYFINKYSNNFYIEKKKNNCMDIMRFINKCELKSFHPTLTYHHKF